MRKATRPGAGRRIVAALGVLWLVAGCYYLRYESLVRTHVDLMVSLAEKRRDLYVAGEPPRASAEYRYPLERGRDFARIVRGRFGERESFRLLEEFLDRYEQALGTSEITELATALTDLRERREAVIAALERE